MRYFISIDVEDEHVNKSFVKFIRAIEPLGQIRTVKPENLHITLLYLGECGEDEEDEITSGFTASYEEIDEDVFQCNFSCVGVFPHINYIKVVWKGVKTFEKPCLLHVKFSEHVTGVGEHDFTPHIMLGRVRGILGEEKQALKSKIERVSLDFGAFQVENVRLKQGVPGEDGPEYEDLGVHRL